MNGGLGNFAARAVVIVSLCLVAIVLVGLVGYALTRGADLNSGQVVGLLGSITVLVGIIAALAQGLLTASGVSQLARGQDEIKSDVKNHIQQHLGHTDEEIQKMIADQVARQLGPPPSPPQGV